jgi:general stress protein 26
MTSTPDHRTKPKDLILRLLNEHRVMAIATNRPDGWPQATLVGYVNDGFLLYCFIARNSQKHANILRDSRVSVAIGSDALLPLDIKGLSFAAKASIVSDPTEIEYISELRLKRYPEYAAVPPPVVQTGTAQRISRRPSRDVIPLRIAPEIISVLDYSRGFGHSNLVTFSERDLDRHVSSYRHRWDDNVIADPSTHDHDER